MADAETEKKEEETTKAPTSENKEKEEKSEEEVRRPSRTRKAPTKYAAKYDSEDDEEEEEVDDDSDDDPSWGAKAKEDSDEEVVKKKGGDEDSDEESGKKKGKQNLNNNQHNRIKAPSAPYRSPMPHQGMQQRSPYPSNYANSPQRMSTPVSYGGGAGGYGNYMSSPQPTYQSNQNQTQMQHYTRWKQQSSALMSQLKKQSAALQSAESNLNATQLTLNEKNLLLEQARLNMLENPSNLQQIEADVTYHKSLVLHSQSSVQVNQLQLQILQQQLAMMNKGISQMNDPLLSSAASSPPPNISLYNNRPQPNNNNNNMMNPANFQAHLQNVRQHHINTANPQQMQYGERMLSHQRLLQQQNVLMREAAQPQAMTQQEIQQRDQLRSMSLFNNDFKNQQRMQSANSFNKMPGSAYNQQFQSQQQPKQRKFVRASLNSDEEEDAPFSDEEEDEEVEGDQDRKLLLGITKQCENYSNKMRKVLNQWHHKSNAKKLAGDATETKSAVTEINDYGTLIPNRSEVKTEASVEPSAPASSSSVPLEEVKKENAEEKKAEEETKKEGEEEKKVEEPKKEEEEKKDDVGDLDLITQPENLKYELRPYQLIGLNWLYLLFQQKINGILADEMGLGKTIQTIALFSLLAQRGEVTKPHVVIAPSTALENWVREFSVWCPSLRVVMYHGTAKDRETLRKQLVPKTGEKLPFDVLITTYNICINKVDRVKLFKKVKFSFIVLDEAHNVKNVGSSRYRNLLKLAFRAENRLMLTGTPLQNNINELWTLLSFLMPTIFSKNKDFTTLVWEEEKEEEEEKQAQLQDPNNPEEISNHSKSGPTVREKQSLNDRLRTQNSKIVDRLKTILSPFVLRRLKSEVLGKLPPKTEKIKWCELVSGQKEMYDRMLQYSKSKYNEMNQIKAKDEDKDKSKEESSTSVENSEEKSKEEEEKSKEKEEMLEEEKELKKDAQILEENAVKGGEESKKEKPTLNHILMQLRKAANNVLFFRNIYDEEKLKEIERLLEEERRLEEEQKMEEEEKQEKVVEDQPFQIVEEEKKKKTPKKNNKKSKKKEQKVEEDEEEMQVDPKENNEKTEENPVKEEEKQAEKEEEKEEEEKTVEEPKAKSKTKQNSEEGGEDSLEDECQLCGIAGDLIICDGPCKRAFHVLCVELEPSEKLPENWFCQECSEGGLKPDQEQPFKTQVNEILDAVESLQDKDGRYRSDLFIWLPCREDYPDYFEIINKPVSLNILRRTPWTSAPKFRDTFFQMIKNAKTYNAPKSEVFEDALALEKVFLEQFAKHFPHLKAQTAKGSGRSSTSSSAPKRKSTSGTPSRESSSSSTPSKRSKRVNEDSEEEGFEDDQMDEETPRKKRRSSTSNTPKSSSKKSSKKTNQGEEFEYDDNDTPRRSSRKKKTRMNEADMDENSDIESYLEARGNSKSRSVSNRSQGNKVKLGEPFITCRGVLEELMDEDGVEPFLEPVDYKALDLDDYLEIVKEPMDLGTVYESLTGGKYETSDDFVADVRKVFDNCLLYNESCSSIGITAQTLWNYFKTQCRKVKIDVVDVGKLGAARRANVSIFEELSYKSDFQIGSICQQHECLKDFRLSDDQIMNSSGKLLQMKKTLSNCQKRGDRVIIFSQFTAVLDILEEFLNRLGYLFVRLDGQTPVLERQVIIDRYNSDKTIFVFLLSTRAGGIGINLTSANVCIFHDIDWNPEMDRQAEARIHRIGQVRPVKIVKLLSKQSVDEYIYTMAQNKKERNDVVMGNNEGKAGDNAGTPDEKLAIGKVLAALFGQ
eukprot:TRINITY_DN1128_c0_g1_i6.p1 TRINITY_DN1128_c0_g1~~TRINITY_DN1128_c0_g1_i6.p1  ORF type:complete len:1774 (-),score=927.22 TRINITY_DN1128_c0_g1_i6:245-5566(-)